MCLVVSELNVETVLDTHLHLDWNVVIFLQLGVRDLDSEVYFFRDLCVVVSVDGDSQEVAYLTSDALE